MSSQVSKAVVKRPYRSPRREQQALETRAAILDAAQSLFEKFGYAATTVEAIAAEARVSPKTVYLAFVTKSALLRAVWDRALTGELHAHPIEGSDWYRALLAEPNPHRQIELVAANACSLKERTASLLRAIRSAALVDVDGADLWNRIQADYLAHQRSIVEAIAHHGGLRKGLDAGRAADILWTLNHPDVWLLLTEERGWSRAAFEEWFVDTLASQILAPPASPRPRRARAGAATAGPAKKSTRSPA